MIEFCMDWRKARNGALVLLAVLAVTPVATAESTLLVAQSNLNQASRWAALGPATDDSETLVEILDGELRKAVTNALGKAPGDPVTRGEMLTLKRLYGSGVSQLGGIEWAANLERLFLAAGDISDLSPLEGLTSLTELLLTDNAISDVRPLSDLTSLTYLALSLNSISDVRPLAGLTSLTDLLLVRNGISDVRSLAGLNSLTWLRLDDNDISDVSPLVGLTSLTSLELCGNEITDASPISGLTSLTDLCLGASYLRGGGNGISDASPLANLASLTSLNLGGNSISDVSPLSDLTSLTSLRLWGNAISDLTPLGGLKQLRRLTLGANGIVDIAPLSGMTALTELDLSNNEIADVSPLAEMTSLITLKLYGNRVAELGPLSGLTSLMTLELYSNQIVDLEPLADLTSLTDLYLSNNEVSDVSPIVANEGLGDDDTIDLQVNPLSGTSLETHIPALVKRGVDVRISADAAPDLREEIRDGELRLAAERAAMLSRRDFKTMLSLDASNRGIEDLAGLEGAAALRGLFLDGNRITDIAPLAALGSLTTLTLAHNRVEDLAPLADMNLHLLALDGNSLRDLPPLPASLSYLYLSDNSLSDIDSLADVWSLRELDVSANSITSLAPLGGQDSLEYLHASDNQVADLSPLNFESLRELHLRNNAVRDLSPLLDGEELLMVDVRRNPLADDALAVLDTLRERRVTVLAGETVPYFPAAGDGREGFVRIVSRSEQGGHVFIEAVDDAGVRAGPVRLAVGARGAVHFNSADLENGNAAKGIRGGIGRPTAGDWRLSVVSALDVEVLSYVRTDDGFLTAMHDVVPDAMAPFFNPGSNERQRSILRMVNTEAEPAKWTTGGYDDRGQWRPMAGSLLVRPQRALTLTASELESAHGLGDGHGKWRLHVRGFPWFAMSLLESPTGHLANLSTAPDNATLLADGTTVYRLPLFPAAGGSREGFMRVINRSYGSGEAAIEAVDDGGDRSGPLTLSLRPRQAVHLNAADLEAGNAAKGLDGGVGVGEGDWRLEVASELDLMVLGYVRTADGFLTSLHDLAPVAEDGSHRVVFFNPGSNTAQASQLRLINDGVRAAQLTITGIDDRGSDSGTARFSVPAGSALTFTSAELEAGGGRLTGRLGDGNGKWRLRVRSDEPISVMSLLETPTGHLTNLSTGTAD